MIMKSKLHGSRGSILEGMEPRGYVRWTLTDIKTGRFIKSGGKHNLLVNKTREELASAIIGGSVTFPGFIGVGTGTTAPAADDTDLETVSQYNGSNDAKAVDSKSIRSLYTARFVVQFATGEANVTIRELALLSAADSGNLWARVAVNIAKTSSERLTIYWYIIFDRSLDVAIKSGASINGTGTFANSTPVTLTFASAVTIFKLTNNTGTQIFFKINEALDGADPPVDYDGKLADGGTFELLNEEVSITTVSVWGTALGTAAAPQNGIGCVGW
tara:strand:- start:151 stop:969 length:819 start_codon:yes stop_codon:yes gene_type:complete